MAESEKLDNRKVYNDPETLTLAFLRNAVERRVLIKEWGGKGISYRIWAYSAKPFNFPLLFDSRLLWFLIPPAEGILLYSLMVVTPHPP